MLLWGLWRGEDAPKNTAKLRRAASETKRNDINEQLAPLCTTTITKAVTCGGRETEDDVLVHFLFVLWLFFFSFFLFSFALCVLCVIFSLLLIKCTTSVINFASSGNCSVCYVCVCVCYATTALATTITITTTTPRGVERDVSPNHSCKECEGRKGRKANETNRNRNQNRIQ